MIVDNISVIRSADDTFLPMWKQPYLSDFEGAQMSIYRHEGVGSGEANHREHPEGRSATLQMEGYDIFRI